jgi:hypothetical protein
VTDQTKICNMALSATGSRDTITSINESSNEAVQCRTHWDHARDDALAMAWWTFARTTSELSLLKIAPGTPEFVGTAAPRWIPDYPPPPWNYEYLIPPECIQPRYIIPGQSVTGTFAVPIFSIQMTAPSQIGGAPIKYITAVDTNTEGAQLRVLLTNVSPALLVYTARVEDPQVWDPQFVTAMTLVLAARIAFSLTGDRGLQGDLAKQAIFAVQSATLLDANQGITVQEITPDWLAIRGVGPLDDLMPYGSVN